MNKMNIKYFTENLQGNIQELLTNCYIADRNLTSLSTLRFSSWTFLINAAMYKLVEGYNNRLEESSRPNSEFLILIPEDNSGKKGGFSDFTIASNDGKTKLFEVEHENDAGRLLKGYEKLTKSPARTKILIGYENKKMGKSKIREQLKNKKEKLKTAVCVNLMISKEEFNWKSVNYKLISI